MSLEIIMGPMFSGKTTHAIIYMRKQVFIGKNVLALKPDIDKRYSDEPKLISHNQEEFPCMLWNHEIPLEYSSKLSKVDFIVIEEAQFFKGLLEFIKVTLFTHGKKILVVGLDADAEQQRFGEILDCIPYATHIQKLTACCSKCGSLAPFTKKFTKQETQIDVGSLDKYMAVCLKHLLE